MSLSPAEVESLPEETFLGILRRRVEEQYLDHPTGCGCSFGELLCYELHNGLTFNWLAAKWGIPVSVLGRRTERSFSRWLGRPATLADLSDDAVNRWLLALLDRGLTAPSVKNERANLLALWRAAYFSRLVETKPDRIRKVHAPRTLPEAWDERQLVALVTVALAIRGRIRAWRMPLSAFFRAYILVGYDSGLRMGDMMALRWDQLGPDGSIAVSQQKTGWPVLCRLRPETMAALEVIRDERRPAIFGGCLSRRAFFTAFQRIVRLAGLEGTSRKLRRSGASLLERTQPGLAQYYLGHTSPKMAEQFYIDQRISRPIRPQPPPLAG